jgi:type II secretory pathway pseudopilin PulG
MRDPRKKQGGYALMALTAALSVVAFGFVIGYSTLLAKKETGQLLEQQKQYMLAAQTALDSVYKANAASIDGDESQGQWRGATSFLDAAGIQPRWGMQTAVSDRLENGDVDYTVVALWLPGNNGAQNPPAFDTSSGVFTPCVKTDVPCTRVYAVYSGLSVQRDLRKRAIGQLNALATKAQSFFKAKALQDPDHNILTNYFRAPSGCGLSSDEMPCLDNYTPVAATNIPGLLGVDASSYTNPWGYPVLASNGSANASTASPFTMGFATQAPWSRQTFTTFAVQPY